MTYLFSSSCIVCFSNADVVRCDHQLRHMGVKQGIVCCKDQKLTIIQAFAAYMQPSYSHGDPIDS